MRNLFPLFLIVILASCSSEKNTWTSKAYHNTTAHFNGYFYANGEIEKIEETIRKSHVDDFNKILRLYPSFDTALASTYDKEVQEAIKMASIAIQRHPNSRWVDDAYILVGKARLYSHDWGNAIQTFKHVNTKSKNVDAKHLAIINLVRTYTEHHEYNNAKAAIDYLQKAKLNKVNEKKFYLERAHYYQQLNDYDNMVRSLTLATPHLKKKDRKGRIFFIVGQVYQKLGFEAEAYNYYKKCLSTNPEYEVDFYARLYMAQVTEISRNRDLNAARKSFRKLLKDKKNKEFKDKIYYEMGVFELRQKNLREAIANFNDAIRDGTNERVDGEAYLRLGEIYYDTLRNYELSQAYYDSAITSLPKDYEGYGLIKTRQEILNEFVKHIKTIKWQDSLLNMASLDSASLMKKVDSVVTARVKLEERKAKKKRNRIEIQSNSNNNAFGNNGSFESTDWYFGNPSAMALGQTEFVRVWGNITLQDNWRRSQRQASSSASLPVNQDSIASENLSKGKSSKEINPVEEEFNRISQEIPKTEEARKAVLKKIEEAYFHLGEIYHFKLFEDKNAIITYLKLLERFPESEFEPEVLYTLYLITKDIDPEKSDYYASELKRKHPNSTYAKILINPNYLQESSQAVEKQRMIYKNAYAVFQVGKYDSANQIVQEAFDLGESSFTPSLKLFRILIVGKKENIAKYQYELEQFIKTYSGNELATYAQKLLDTSREFQNVQEKRRGIQYIRSLEEPHYFVMVYKRADKIDEKITAALEDFNESNFSDWGLKTSNLILDDEYALTFVADLPRVSAAIEYFKTFSENPTPFHEIRNYKFNNFVITKDNFDIFYRTKGLDEYLQFFEKNYPTVE